MESVRKDRTLTVQVADGDPCSCYGYERWWWNVYWSLTSLISNGQPWTTLNQGRYRRRLWTSCRIRPYCPYWNSNSFWKAKMQLKCSSCGLLMFSATKRPQFCDLLHPVDDFPSFSFFIVGWVDITELATRLVAISETCTNVSELLSFVSPSPHSSLRFQQTPG